MGLVLPLSGLGVTSVPQRVQRFFDPVDSSPGVARNFGINLLTTVTTPSTNNFTNSPDANGVSLGTTLQAIDGLILSFSADTGRILTFRITLDNGATWAVNNYAANATQSNLEELDIPLRIGAGVTVKISIATTAGASFSVFAKAYQTPDSPSPIHRIEGLGPYTTPNNQGIIISTASTWTPFSATTAACLGICSVFAGVGNDTSRTDTGLAQLGVASGAAGSEQVVMPNIIAVAGSTSVRYAHAGPHWQNFPSGTVFSMRAKQVTTGTLLDAYNGQLMLMYAS